MYDIIGEQTGNNDHILGEMNSLDPLWPNISSVQATHLANTNIYLELQWISQTVCPILLYSCFITDTLAWLVWIEWYIIAHVCTYKPLFNVYLRAIQYL